MDFENRFGRLSTRDQAILATNKMVMFLKAVDIRDHKDLEFLLEDITTQRQLMNIWGNVWDIVAQYTKRWHGLGRKK